MKSKNIFLYFESQFLQQTINHLAIVGKTRSSHAFDSFFFNFPMVCQCLLLKSLLLLLFFFKCVKQVQFIINFKQNYKMSKMVILFSIVMFLAVNTSAQVFYERQLQNVCCSSCAEAKVPISPILHTKQQYSIINAISQNYNLSMFMTLMKKFPPVFTKNLHTQILDVQFRNASSLQSRGGITTKQKSYSNLDQGTINFYFNLTKSVLLANMTNLSRNNLDTVTSFIQKVRQSYNQKIQAVQSDLTDGTTGNLNSFAMQLAMGFMSSFSNQQQNSVFNCLQVANNQFSISPYNFSQNFNMVWKIPMEDQFLGPFAKVYQSSQISSSNKSYFYKKSIYPDNYCPYLSAIDSMVNSSSRRLSDISSTGNILLTTFNILFERRAADQPDIYSPIFLELLSELNFQGTITSEDVSAPNGGFGPNEDPLSIWNGIVNKVFRSMLFYRLPGLKAALEQSCPLTCNIGC